MPPFFEKLFRINLPDQKALRGEASGACTPRVARPGGRRRMPADGESPPPVPPTIEIFPSFQETDSRSGAFGVSVLLHVGILLILIALPLIFTSSLKPNYNEVALIAPPVEKSAPPPLDLPREPEPRTSIEPVAAPSPAANEPPPKAEPKPRTEAPIPIPIPKPPIVEEPSVPAPVPVMPRRLAEPEAAIAAPRLAVQTGVFSKTGTAPATASLRTIQTGGFGDPNGVPAGKSNHEASIAVGGSFASAAPPGYPGYQAAAVRNVRQGGFEAVQEAAPRPAPRKIDAGPPDKPVEILYKPKPDYTDEARRLRVEGEVLVHVLFKATGEISVLDVVRGLGHGLDETATRAAGQIRFKPAMRGGRPIDSAATVHIIFQLAF